MTQQKIIIGTALEKVAISPTIELPPPLEDILIQV